MSAETCFPLSPAEVATLTVAEFAFRLDLDAAPSLDEICERFPLDANRALVWCIRYRALAAWRRADASLAWLNAHPGHLPHLAAVAASFALNDDWEFDCEAFRAAVERCRR
jgi:hypothetical protein